ncbi:HlyD family efflux transporter periplasmic adaptor subunit [Acinetobacter sp. NS-4]|uniref:HlyD family efflux transporter periplasmic adaptor subunit n=1 Tax=Acinetobacter sp. NS-4 TaxID=3127956 RepID=UPI00307E7244
MNKKVIIAGVILVVIAAAMTYWMLHKNKDSSAELTLYGNVDIRQVSLAFEEVGRIKALNVQEGDKVKTGQIVALLDTQALQIQAKQAEAQLKVQQQTVIEQDVGTRPEQITQAKAQLASAQAQLDKARKDLSRFQALYSSTNGQAISQQELDSAKSNENTAIAAVNERQANLKLLQKGPRQEDRAAAKAAYEALQSNLELIQYRIAQSELRSPTNAVVRARLQEVGDMTTPQKAVYTLALTDPKWIRVYVNETDLGQIKMGSTAQIRVDSQPNHPLSGKIGYISSVAEFTPKSVQTEEIRTTLVYEVRIYVQDIEDKLKMGQPVTVKIQKSAVHAEKNKDD